MSERKIRLKTKLIFGVGINDADYHLNRCHRVNGKSVSYWTCPYYARWYEMLRRCLSKRYKSLYNSYKDATVCEDWLTFSNFKKWVDYQPNRDWENCELDKDILIPENKIYSPDSCVFITPDLNKFLLDSRKTQGIYLIGVCFNKNSGKFLAQISTPKLLGGSKHRSIGLFDTELEAHLAWKTKKHEYACKLADMQDDPRVAEALRNRYRD